ncbi:MAG: magnesium/cobalt transporter CorA [Sumerlaeia bacterium]
MPPHTKKRHSSTLRSLTRPKTLNKLLRGRARKPPGLPPGTLTRTERPPGDAAPHFPLQIAVMTYDEAGCRETRNVSAREALALREPGKVNWIDVEGHLDPETVQFLGEALGIHPLVQEDILNTDHRPKFEDYGTFFFAVLKMIEFRPESASVHIENVSIVLTPDTVLFFQEEHDDVFERIRDRIRTGLGGRIRKLGADYLAYALMDAIVDHYLITIDRLSAGTENLELEILDDPHTSQMQQILGLKGESIVLRKAILPLREAFTTLQHTPADLISKNTRIFMRDVRDHLDQSLENIDTLREVLTVLLDLYLSSVSNRQNQVTYTLTLVATIFLPLTFIAGVYGMNFKYMPLLEYRYGYPVAWAIMIGVAGGMLLWFKRKNWL